MNKEAGLMRQRRIKLAFFFRVFYSKITIESSALSQQKEGYHVITRTIRPD